MCYETELTIPEIETSFNCTVTIIGTNDNSRKKASEFIFRHAENLLDSRMSRVHLLGFYSNNYFAVLITNTSETIFDLKRNDQIVNMERDYDCIIEIVAANPSAFRTAENFLIERTAAFVKYGIRTDSFPCFVSAYEFAISVRSSSEFQGG